MYWKGSVWKFTSKILKKKELNTEEMKGITRYNQQLRKESKRSSWKDYLEKLPKTGDKRHYTDICKHKKHLFFFLSQCCFSLSWVYITFSWYLNLTKFFSFTKGN